MKNINKILSVVMLLLLPLYTAQAGGLMISDAWIRAIAPGMSMTAGYMGAHNMTGKKLVLVGATSEAFGRVEIHKSVMEDGMMKMTQQDSVEIGADKMVMFRPKGLHLMLMMPKRDLKLGEKITITLKFNDGTSQAVAFVVKNAAMKGDMGNMKH